MLALTDHFHEAQFPLHRFSIDSQIIDPVNRDKPLELVLDLLDHVGCARGDDRDPGNMLLVLGFGDGQAFDIVAASREEAGNARQDTRLVIDDHRERYGD